MMDATLAQLFNHIVEKELELMQQQQRITFLEQELAKYTKDIPNPVQDTQVATLNS